MKDAMLTLIQFHMPPSGKVWTVIIVSKELPQKDRTYLQPLTAWQVNSLASFASDLSWAFAMLLTTPLVVTVGLSLTIPLSLIGEMIQYGQYSSFVYWIGAAVVFVSFVFVNNESQESEPSPVSDAEAQLEHPPQESALPLSAA